MKNNPNLTHDQNMAAHLYEIFMAEQPTDAQRDHLSREIETLDSALISTAQYHYLIHPTRLHDAPKNKMLLIYTSCHAHQIIRYLTTYRPNLMREYDVYVLYTHLLILGRPHFDLRLIHAMFEQADVIITNPMNPKFGELSTVDLLPRVKSGATVVTFVPPSMGCFWPVAEYFGEQPVHRYLAQGLEPDAVVNQYLNGSFECMFYDRWRMQIERLKAREQDADVHISRFIDDWHVDYKMFFAPNHPTFHLIGHIMDGCLERIGHDKYGDSFNLGLPTNGGEMRNHHPETQYEWDYFKFTYPPRFTTDWGGHQQFYADAIRSICKRVKGQDHSALMNQHPDTEP